MKLIILFNTILIFLLFMTGCTAIQPEEQSKIRIAFITETFVIERWQRDRDVFVARAQELGAEVIVRHTFEDSEEQIRVIEEMIRQNVDVIVVIPHDKDALTPVIRRAIDQGIRVIAYDRLVMNAEIDLYISFDNFAVGELMAQYVTKSMPSGRFVIINGSPFDHNSFMLREGYMGYLNDSIISGDIEIVAETWAEGWRGEVAYEFINKLISEGESFDAIIAANDLIAEGAIKALSENRLAGVVYVTGQDSELAACQRIVEGTQLMTVYKPIGVLAKSAAEAAIKLANNELPEYDELISNGAFDIPFIKHKPVAVTKYNIVDTVIRDGFHLREDIFRNIPQE